MIDTDKLIYRLAANPGPIRPLSSPWIRTSAWLALALPYVTLIVLAMSPRADLAAKLAESAFVVEEVAALATAITAAMAAFVSIIPGHDRKVLVLPAVPLAIWLGSVAWGCIAAFVEYGWDSLDIYPDWTCFPSIVVVSAIPAIAMAVMLHRGAPLMPFSTAVFGALAATALGDFALRLFHSQDASLTVLVWQIGTVFVLTTLAGFVGRHFFNWSSVIAGVRRKVAAASSALNQS